MSLFSPEMLNKLTKPDMIDIFMKIIHKET